MNALSLSPLPRPSLSLATPRSSRTPSSGARLFVPRRGRRAAARIPVSAVPHEARTEEPPPPSLSGEEEERFEWLDQWYPFAPVCDLDPRAPHGKTVLGLSVVAWYDRRGAGAWRVFENACPHRLAPISEGCIDGEGLLQCAYHGWCLDGAGACRFIPQAPALGPPGAQEQQGVRGVVPMRGEEQSPVVLPEDGGRAQRRAVEEAAAVHSRDRRPVLPHRVRREGSLLRVGLGMMFWQRTSWTLLISHMRTKG